LVPNQSKLLYYIHCNPCTHDIVFLDPPTHATPIHLCTLDIAEGSVPSQWPLAAILSPADINSIQNSQPASPSHLSDEDMQDNDVNSVQHSQPPSLSHKSDQEMQDKDVQDSGEGTYLTSHLLNS